MSSKFTQKDLEQYLAGNAPLHPERLALPSEEELDAAEKEFDRFVAKQKQPARLIAFWPFAAAVAAVLVAVFLLRSAKSSVIPEEKVEQEVTIVQAEQTEQPKQEEVIEPVKIAAHTPHKHQKTPKINEICEVETHEEVAEVAPMPEETQQEEEVEVSPIPADKQALANIFLAEEALQVAYELQAQQEAIRAYAASLIGVELPKPIIAF